VRFPPLALTKGILLGFDISISSCDSEYSLLSPAFLHLPSKNCGICSHRRAPRAPIFLFPFSDVINAIFEKRSPIPSKLSPSFLPDNEVFSFPRSSTSGISFFSFPIQVVNFLFPLFPFLPWHSTLVTFSFCPASFSPSVGSEKFSLLGKEPCLAPFRLPCSRSNRRASCSCCW